MCFRDFSCRGSTCDFIPVLVMSIHSFEEERLHDCGKCEVRVILSRYRTAMIVSECQATGFVCLKTNVEVFTCRYGYIY